MNDYYNSSQAADANLHVGRERGKAEGFRDGHRIGLQKGYAQGREDGYHEGRKEAVAEANEKMRIQIGYTEVWQRDFYRLNIIMNSMRQVLDKLTSEDTPQTALIKKLFAEEYAKEVSAGLSLNEITVAPELDTDPKLAKLPKTKAFIARMIGS